MTDNEAEITVPKLGDDFDKCLIGASVETFDDTRYVYSLIKLIRVTMVQQGTTAEEARAYLATQITEIHREHGPRAPIFVDDELVQGRIEDEKIKLILPGSPGYTAPPKLQ